MVVTYIKFSSPIFWEQQLWDHKRFVGGFQWCGITAFVQSWQVTNRIHGVLGQLDGYSMATVIATTGSNWGASVLKGYGRMKTHPSTMLLCCFVQWCLLANWLYLITWLEQASYEKKSNCSCGSTFSHNQPAFTGYVVQRTTLLTSGGLVLLLVMHTTLVKTVLHLKYKRIGFMTIMLSSFAIVCLFTVANQAKQLMSYYS
jgi:hypothetical protein